MNRRDLVQKIAMGGAVIMLVPSVLSNCKSSPKVNKGENIPETMAGAVPETVIQLDLSLAENSALNSTGVSMVVKGIIIANTGSGNFIALSSVCTHKGCTVGYDSKEGNIKCPCHGAVFTTKGSVVSGPAENPLKSYPVSKNENILTISL
jgi:cytochrome b6-f complex iron-sulfur subunit